MKINRAVKVHGGAAYVRGKARKYPYFVASLFVKRQSANGQWRWVNSGIHTRPRRSLKLAESDGAWLAKRRGATLVEGFGSLHNVPTTPKEEKAKRFNLPKLLDDFELESQTAV